MPLKPVTVFLGSDLEHEDAFAAHRWTEILLDVDKALSVEQVDQSKLRRGTPPTPADVSPPVIPPTVAGQPPTIQHTFLPTRAERAAAAGAQPEPFPVVTIRFPNVTSPYTAKGEIKDFAQGGTPPKYDDGKGPGADARHAAAAEKGEPIAPGAGATYTPPKAEDLKGKPAAGKPGDVAPLPK